MWHWMNYIPVKICVCVDNLVFTWNAFYPFKKIAGKQSNFFHAIMEQTTWKDNKQTRFSGEIPWALYYTKATEESTDSLMNGGVLPFSNFRWAAAAPVLDASLLQKKREADDKTPFYTILAWSIAAFIPCLLWDKSWIYPLWYTEIRLLIKCLSLALEATIHRHPSWSDNLPPQLVRQAIPGSCCRRLILTSQTTSFTFQATYSPFAEAERMYQIPDGKMHNHLL